MNKLEILRTLTFGARVAEEEKEELKQYFVKTDQWNKIFKGDIDIIYGPKGSGKSAIYSFLSNSEDELFLQNILITPAENPRGTPAFKNLTIDPPVSEIEFIKLWKIYFLIIIGSQIIEYKLKDDISKKLVDKLAECKLIPSKKTLAAYLTSAFNYVKSLSKIESLQPGVDINPISGIPEAFNFKITFREPDDNQLENGYISINELFEEVNQAMKNNGLILWVVLDRLDVAFYENSVLEKNALRALFKVYLDLNPYENIKLKVFLRDDIWKKITEDGFREASHITRHTTIEWNRESLLNLIMKRILNNNHVLSHFNIDKEYLMSDINKQTQFFYKMFPYEMGHGEMSKTLDWIIGRTKDAKGINSPREIIHLLNTAKDIQIKSLEIGGTLPNSELIDNYSIRKSMPEVSKVRITSVLYAEYPEFKEFIELLINEKSVLQLYELSKIWGRNRKNSLKIAIQLVNIGFFEKHGTKDKPYFTVPFLYRPYLKMT